MPTQYDCIVAQHDLWLVALAVTICALASFVAVLLLPHIRDGAGKRRRLWLAVASIATGFGVWATHFGAMLAFSPGLQTGYNLCLTALSLVGAIVLTTAAIGVALKPSPQAPALGGMIFGVGVAVTHYTGMAAFEIEARVAWNPWIIAASVAIAVTLGALALTLGVRSHTLKARIGAALALTAAIGGHHFIAMSALTITPDPGVRISSAALSVSSMAIAVALTSVGIVAVAFLGLWADARRRGLEIEAGRMRGLANAAVEGILVCQGNVIVTANNSFVALSGLSHAELCGARLDTLFSEETLRQLLVDANERSAEVEMRGKEGTPISVEIVSRPINFMGAPHRVVAARDIRARKAVEEHIRFLADHDTLTRLPNRNSFYAKLDREIEFSRFSGRRLAILFVDLDRFKEVNDLHGHDVGDRLLQSFSRIAIGELDSTQTAARLGGDEFAILLPKISGPEVAVRVAENLIEAMRVENAGSESLAFLSASIGIAVFPDDAASRELLLTYADIALHRAKSEKRGGYRFFEAMMGARVRDRRMLEHDLRYAIERNELRMVYQPQKDIMSAEVFGFEALLRWRHSVRGDVSPSEFIPLAEESGIILELEDWVLRTACAEAAGWRNPLTVAVNVSAASLHNPGFAQQLREILEETGMPSERLELEITETTLIRDFRRALTTMTELKALGVRIAMDDFGTGYSSLSYLRAFPFDKIKIDRSFVAAVHESPQSAAIVRAVLGLGRSLELPVVAEGVETQDELDFLAQAQCREIQGFLVGRPADIRSYSNLTQAEAGDCQRVA